MIRPIGQRLTIATLVTGMWLAGLLMPSVDVNAAPQNWGNSWHNNPFSCQVSATGMSFGSYSVFSTSPLDSAATLRISCTQNKPGNGAGQSATTMPVEISFGEGETGTVSDRYMTASPMDNLQYQIYADAARRTVLGDGSLGTTTLTMNAGSSTTVTVFGRVFARQDVYPGNYRDSVRVTILF